jgi:hypothetical protein
MINPSGVARRMRHTLGDPEQPLDLAGHLHQPGPLGGEQQPAVRVVELHQMGVFDRVHSQLRPGHLHGSQGDGGIGLLPAQGDDVERHEPSSRVFR